jgi:hypothetical protein
MELAGHMHPFFGYWYVTVFHNNNIPGTSSSMIVTTDTSGLTMIECTMSCGYGGNR